MDALINLLQEFLASRITPLEFSLRFLDIWRALRDEQYRMAEQKPELAKAERELSAKRLAGQISADAFMAAYRPLAQKLYEDCTIKAFSKEEEIVGDLFDVTEPYYPREIYRAGDVTDAELLEAATKALDRLTSQPRA